MQRDPATPTTDVRFGTFGYPSSRSAQLEPIGVDSRTVTGRTSRWYLVAGALAVFCFLVVPPVAGGSWLVALTGASAVGAIGFAVGRYRPTSTVPWLLFLLAQALVVGGYVLTITLDLTSPSVADALYLASYPLLGSGLLLVTGGRPRAPDAANLLDALIVAIGFGLPVWLYLDVPYASGDFASLVSMAYPTMDVLLLAVAARLMIGGGVRSRSFVLMVASVFVLILTDVGYGIIERNGSYHAGGWLDAGWMGASLLLGAAALDPSMRELSAARPVVGAALTRRRVLLLAAAALIAPASMILNEARSTEGFNETVAAAATGVVFVLVLIRMLGLVSSQRDAAARHERAERRETILRHASTALTAVSDREYVRLAALEGAVALARDLPDPEVVVDLHAMGAVEPSTSAPESQQTVAVSLSTRASPYGRLVLTSSAPVPTDIADALRTLGAQVALALEAVALTEGLSKQRSEARVGALVQNSTDMIMVVDADYVIRYVTPSVAQTLGHRPEELVGKPATSLAEPGDQDLVRDFYAGIAEKPGTSVTAEWRMRRSDGGFTEFEAVVCNLLANPSVQGIVVTAHDITDRKALEVGLKRQVRELEELDRLRNDFVATVSHELRTPLTNIIGEVELLQDGDRGELTSCQAHGVDVINRNSDRLLGLIEDLLTLSEVEESSVVLHPEPTRVANLVVAVGNQVSSAAEAKSVALEIDYGTNSGVIVADPVQLDRALLNLLDNAVKFTPAGGKAALRVGRVGDDVEFTVTDTGIGIPEAEQVRLFTRFFRSSEATRLAIQGTGLGLVIVKRIVEAHGGTVSIASKPDVGTTVTVRLPAGDRVGVVAGAA